MIINQVSEKHSELNPSIITISAFLVARGEMV